jgi:hypothetical protein
VHRFRARAVVVARTVVVVGVVLAAVVALSWRAVPAQLGAHPRRGTRQ